ncbi:unnamed protein product [marine sediment metagenome]|uniref:Uncharacterized protein n=1 Tax=marine sediment metagenome TaxID=412755 RepID=X0U260_9ZZZZ
MKAKLVFSDLWEDMEVQFYRKTELEFVPSEGMQFNLEPDPFELFVNTTIWYHDEGLLIVLFRDVEHISREHFIDSVRATIGLGDWKYRADKKGGEIINMILKEEKENPA